MRYQDINAETVDRWVEQGWEWGKPVDHETYTRALSGDWQVLLTPTKPTPHEWFGDLRGKRLLGLASGGGQQMPILTAVGAVCSVMDYSPKQLENERIVSEREGYSIEIVRADMTQTFPFEDASFDIIFHPVSNCYVREIDPIFRECFRVLRSGGILMCGLGNGLEFAFSDDGVLTERLPFDPLVNEEQRLSLQKDDSGMQFSHTTADQIGAQLRAGFILTDIYDDFNSFGKLDEYGVPTYMATRAVKP